MSDAKACFELKNNAEMKSEQLQDDECKQGNDSKYLEYYTNE